MALKRLRRDNIELTREVFVEVKQVRIKVVYKTRSMCVEVFLILSQKTKSARESITQHKLVKG